MAEGSATKQRGPGRPFPKGVSGNLAGRPKGRKNDACLLSEALMEGAIDGIVQSVIQKALGGDIAAAKLVLDRIHVVPKSARISADLPDVTTAEGVIAARALIVRMVASGEIRTDEAESLSRVISDQQTAHDLLEMTTLMRQLEKR